MKIACIGGGPAGLYLGVLVKRIAPEHDVVIYERNRPEETFGFGVVFSDATLGHLAAADPETHAQIASKFARWDDIEIHIGPGLEAAVLRSTGHGFCGLERKTLLQILQQRAIALGVRIEFEHEIKSLSEVTADVVVACDGVASWVRDALAAELQPRVDVRPNKFVWLGCTVPYKAFTFLFKPTPYGLFRVHAYRFHDQGSTFIVECRESTWRAAGLDRGDEDHTVAVISELFADELRGHRLIKNRSIWRSFPTVRCAKWHAGNVVLLGDAAHTAHFSIGSGTKLAMEDAIVLRDELLGQSTIAAALAGYEARRRPEVESLQAAAQASLEWFEGTERYMAMAPAQLTYSLMTRSLRVSHAGVARRDPHLAHGIERLLAASVGVTQDPPPPPTTLPYPIGDRRAPSRIAVAASTAGARPWPAALPTGSAVPWTNTGAAGGAVAGDDELVTLGAAAAAGAGLVVTPAIPVFVPGVPGADASWATPRINTDEQAVAWQRIVDYVHAKGALIVARIATRGAVPGALEAAVERAAFVGFDLLLLDPGPEPLAIEHLAAMIGTARGKWRPGGWIAAVVHDRPPGLASGGQHSRMGVRFDHPQTRSTIAGHAAQLVRAGANLLWVSSAGDVTMAGARLPAAPLADRLRNELGVATAIVVDGPGSASLSDLDGAIAAGRADLVIVERLPPEFRPRRT